MRRVLISLLAAAVLLGGCAAGGNTEPADERYAVYYLDTGPRRSGDAIRMSMETLELAQDADLAAKAEAVVLRLLDGSREDEELVSPLPGNVRLLGLEVRDKRAFVDLSAGFDQLGGVELMLADYCVVLSLTALEGIQAVNITSQGRAVLQQPKQIFFERDVRLLSMEDMMQTVEVTLYFGNETGALAGERRVLEIYEGQGVAETLVMELLGGPESRELAALFPREVVVTSVRVEAGVCYVNFLASSLERLPEDGESQERILWSLAESLYSLEAVREIRVLADGRELELFGQIPTELIASRAQG